MMANIVIYFIVFLYGIIIGSFLNVCILRIPLKETIVSKRSHCMSCGHQLAWYDLFPLFSYLFLRGKCRYCKTKISKQYPIVEFINGAMAVLCFAFASFRAENLANMNALIKVGQYQTGEDVLVTDWFASIYEIEYIILCCVLCSVLIVISVIDWRTFEIPVSANIVILVLGIINLVSYGYQDSRYFKFYCDAVGKNPGFFELLYARGRVMELIIGFFAVSVPLAIIYYASKGRAIGGGDVKLMAVAGLFLGWKLIIVALIAGCLYGSVIHIIRMKVSGEGKQLAMGPYLSAGIVTALWFGKDIVTWYSGFFN
ncbi:MAG: prepilin peptidase [Lachnospiraceae bacterium]|nr:prepilin peptidase [Lachnospiraceae bacterium]